MVEIEKPRIECIDSPEDASYGRYIVEPLERGYGTTLGNSLQTDPAVLPAWHCRDLHQDRRCAARIFHDPRCEGRCDGDRPEHQDGSSLGCTAMGVKTVYIDAAGECEVTAGDIKVGRRGRDPEPGSAHLHPWARMRRLNMEITMSHGRGYVPADRNKTAADAHRRDSSRLDLYPRSTRSNYTVENTRVGNMTDYDKLTPGGLDGLDHLRAGCRLAGRQDPCRPPDAVH